MEETGKLITVIHHWIEHNEDHMGEYKKWAEKAAGLSFAQASAAIGDAIKELSQANQHLRKALETLTGGSHG